MWGIKYGERISRERKVNIMYKKRREKYGRKVLERLYREQMEG